MKQRLLKALSLAAIALCSATTAWADRVAPTLPPAVEPQNEQCYWIYCPEAAKFVGSDTYGNYASLSEQGYNIYLVQSGNFWNLRPYSLSGYNLSDETSRLNWRNAYSTSSYAIKQSGDAYTLRSAIRTTFIGYNESDNLLNSNSEAAVLWQFMAADKASHYAAEKALYDALAATDGHGWMRDQYEQMYNNRATATNLELNQAAEELNNALDMSTASSILLSQNDYSIMLGSSQKWNKSSQGYLYNYLQYGQTASITASVETTEKADLCYRLRTDYNIITRVYLDGVEVRKLSSNALYNKYYFHALEPGKHTIKWSFENTSSTNYSNVYLESLCVANTPLITVNCPIPGSFGTEILYNVNTIKDVRNLKVIGELNSEDMDRLMMLTNAHYIDLSEATCTANIPENAFQGFIWLHSFKLAEGIKSIGKRAFYSSDIEEIALPATLRSIGSEAFHESNLKAIDIPNSVTTLGDGAFSNCYCLEEVNYSEGLKTIPQSAFDGCFRLKPFDIPEGVTEIGNSAFYQCSTFVPSFPSTLKSIGSSAFRYCRAIETLSIPDGVKTIEQGAFSDCNNLEEITLPMNFYRSENILNDCTKLKKITLRSGAVVKVPYDQYGYATKITNNALGQITLCVPDYLVVPYKLDKYWYNFGDIVGFPSESIKDYTIHNDLYLDPHSRINGDPNLTIEDGALRIEGDAAMGITNFQTSSKYYYSDSWDGFNLLSQVRSGCENITIKDSYTHKVGLYGGNWFFLSLPFDCKVSDITDITDGRLHAVRYYDGAERAATGTGSSWKKFASENAVIPAGQGFIIQVDGSFTNYAWIQFKSQDNASKQYIFSKKEFSKHLDKNPSSEERNQGWNLVGNPYQCYYDTHKLNFTAPITVWDRFNKTYVAYSIIDDDYALRPNEAFFVQCPSALDAITFPVGGKQFDATILTQNASQRRAAATSSRKMLNLTLSNDEATDQTRIVINDEASLGYEAACDASKFMSMDNTVAQLYTLDDQGTQYAINERPYDDGFVQLGATFATDGTYTIALTRGDMGSVFLTDLETGETTDLTLSEYTFYAAAGTANGRFLISFAGEGNLTAIEALTNSAAAEYYTIDGRHAGNNRSALGKGVYVVRSGNRSAKILVD